MQIIFPGGHLIPLALLASLSLLFTNTSARPGRNSARGDDATSTTAQLSTPFVEPGTGLAMERFFGARTTFGFAMTMPETPAGDFIGQLTFPLVGGSGWGSMGLIGDMENNFILAAWPDGAGGIMASFRQAIDKDNPAEVAGDFSVRPIAKATSVNDTFLTFTFLCQRCMDSTLGLGPEAAGADATMGWALSEKDVADPGSPGSSIGFHERGFGPFTMRLGAARSADFDAVAATAGDPIAASANAVQVVPNAASSGNGGEGDSAKSDEGDAAKSDEGDSAKSEEDDD